MIYHNTKSDLITEIKVALKMKGCGRYISMSGTNVTSTARNLGG